MDNKLLLELSCIVTFVTYAITKSTLAHPIKTRLLISGLPTDEIPSWFTNIRVWLSSLLQCPICTGFWIILGLLIFEDYFTLLDISKMFVITNIMMAFLVYVHGEDY